MAVYLSALADCGRRHPPSPARSPAAADAEIFMQLLWSVVVDDLAAVRNRAVVAFGLAPAARRSEFVDLDVADLAWEERGVRVTIRRSKTDQEAEGQVVAIAVSDRRRLEPVRYLKAWLKAASIAERPVFRSLWKGGRMHDARLFDGHAGEPFL